VDPLSALNVVGVSAPTVAYQYARIRFKTKAGGTTPCQPLGINFNMMGWLCPIS